MAVLSIIQHQVGLASVDQDIQGWERWGLMPAESTVCRCCWLTWQQLDDVLPPSAASADRRLLSVIAEFAPSCLLALAASTGLHPAPHFTLGSTFLLFFFKEAWFLQDLKIRIESSGLVSTDLQTLLCNPSPWLVSTACTRQGACAHALFAPCDTAGTSGWWTRSGIPEPRARVHSNPWYSQTCWAKLRTDRTTHRPGRGGRYLKPCCSFKMIYSAAQKRWIVFPFHAHVTSAQCHSKPHICLQPKPALYTLSKYINNFVFQT